MADDQPASIRFILECEARIGRIRAAIRDGRGNAEEAGAEFEALQNAVKPTFAGFARRLRWIGAYAEEEALDAMNDRLFVDIWSLDYPSLETGFGVYLKHMPIRALQRTARNYRGGSASELIERLDQVAFEDGAERHELVEDPKASAQFGRLLDNADLQQALDRLTEPERTVVELRMREVENAAIAERLECITADRDAHLATGCRCAPISNEQ